MTKYYLPLLLFLISCNSKGNTANNPLSQTVTFEMMDSIQVEYLGSPTVHDLDPIKRTFLFMEHREFSEEIMVADFDGNIQASFSKDGDMPDSYGALMSMLRINGDSSFISYGYNGFITYDFSGKLKARVNVKDFDVPTFQMKAMGFGMEKLGKRYLHIDQGSQSLNYNNIDFYRELRLFNWLDPKTGEKERFIPFPDASIFRSGIFFF